MSLRNRTRTAMGALGRLPRLVIALCIQGALLAANAAVQPQPYSTLVANYTPFLAGRPGPQFPVVAYVKGPSNSWLHPSGSKERFPTLQEVHEREADFATVVLRLPDGSAFKTYNALVLGPYLAAVYSGDFNGDGVPDFMAIKPTTGCGIAGEQSLGVFAISNGRDYRFTRVRGWGLGPHSLVLDPATKTFRFMHTTFRGGETLDGRYHTFWVHRFFEWSGAQFQEDARRAPIWIQYLQRPNHEETKLLSPPLRHKIWREDGPEGRIEW